MTAYQLVHTAVFEDCVESYRGNNRVSAALGQAVLELMRKPFENPRLQTHRVDRAQGRTFTSYVGNQGHRVRGEGGVDGLRRETIIFQR